MTTTEAREVLIRYNTWRRYNGPLEQTPLQPEPKKIGEAIDVAIEVLSEEEASLDEAARHVYESWMGGTMDDVRRDMVELGKVHNVRKVEGK